MSNPGPRRTRTFCASGAAIRKVTRLSGRTQGYGAPGMLSAFGRQSLGGCAQALPAAMTSQTRDNRACVKEMLAMLTPLRPAAFPHRIERVAADDITGTGSIQAAK